MTRIRVRTAIDAPPRRVWSDISDLASHVEWMDDAERIDFTSDRRKGVGTRFDCRTRVGPFRMKDRMEVVGWDEGRSIRVVHSGLVTGTGTFTLRRRVRGGTTFGWEERIRVPLRFGGPIGGIVAKVVLRRVWKRNLANLAGRFG